jgi:hypothetical protein
MTQAEAEVIEAAREWGHKLIGGEPEPGRRLWLALVDLKKERGEPVSGADFWDLCRQRVVP